MEPPHDTAQGVRAHIKAVHPAYRIMSRQVCHLVMVDRAWRRTTAHQVRRTTAHRRCRTIVRHPRHTLAHPEGAVAAPRSMGEVVARRMAADPHMAVEAGTLRAVIAAAEGHDPSLSRSGSPDRAGAAFF